MKIILFGIFILLRTKNISAEISLPLLTTLKNSKTNDGENNFKITEQNVTVESVLNSKYEDDPLIENLSNLTLPAALTRSRRDPPHTIRKHRTRYVKRRPKLRRRRVKKTKIRYGQSPIKFSYGEPPEIYFAHEQHGNIYNSNVHPFNSDINIQSFELFDNGKRPIEYEFNDKHGENFSGSDKIKKTSLNWDSISSNLKKSYQPGLIYNEPIGDEKLQSSPPHLLWEQKLPEQIPRIVARKPHYMYGAPLPNDYFQTVQNAHQPTSQDNYNPSNYEPSIEEHNNSPPQDTYKLEELFKDTQATYQPPQNNPKGTFKSLSPDPSIHLSQENYKTIENYKPSEQESYERPSQHIYKPSPPKTNEPKTYKQETNLFSEIPGNIDWTYGPSYDISATIQSTNSTLNPDTIKTSTESNQNNKNSYFEEQFNTYDDFIPPSGDVNLPLDDDHKFPSYDFPKTSYEVPIYNFVPFNSELPPKPSENNKLKPIASMPRRPNLPKPNFEIKVSANNSTFSTSLEELVEPPPDYLDGIVTSRRKRRKQQHSRESNKKQHTLDVDELRDAFSSNTRSDYIHRSSAERSRVQNRNNFKRALQNFVLTSSTKAGVPTKEISREWEPVKLQQNDDNKKEKHVSKEKKSKHQLLQNRNLSMEKTKQINNVLKEFEVLSIQKSRSLSFHSGPTSSHQLNQTNYGARNEKI